MSLYTYPASAATSPPMPLADAPCFMETQFPVAKISMESYKERTAKQGQTLTGLGKWWGRKPLVLVRAAILGLLLPSTDDPLRDREIFLKLMTMDSEGLRARKSKAIPGVQLLAELQSLPPSVQRQYLDATGITLKRLTRDEREALQNLVFARLSYVEKLEYCNRPEQIDGPSPEAWREINAHLGTNAQSLPILVEQLGIMRFGHRPRVGDAFCGGGSVPFEAARMGCDAYGSDLNPVAALLTWAALNIVGGGEEVVEAVQQAQKEVYEAVDRQIIEWGIEHNEQGWRADAYLYCVEVIDPETGWRVPLSPSWIIGKKTNTIARLVPDVANRCYEIEIIEGVSDGEMVAASVGTIRDSRVVHPYGQSKAGVPIEVIRQGLRQWENEDVIPRPGDVFQERLYCIRWVETYQDPQGREQINRHYCAPTTEDLECEARLLNLLYTRFGTWQEQGYIPSRRIEPGYNTDQPIRERGWTHWHHLFNPRQLLTLGCFFEQATSYSADKISRIGIVLGAARAADYNARLSRWHSHGANEKSEQVFSNQALNTLYNYGCRSLTALSTAFQLNIRDIANFPVESMVAPRDSRGLDIQADIWVTDPPYADAIYYHELSEFFLAWYERQIEELFPTWYTDSKRVLAIRGVDHNFRQNMVDCYTNLARHTFDNGLQIVMFTHQDAAVWADLSLILWAAGLRVTAAWTIATETDSALKAGNYVQGTVLLVLRKRTETEPVFLDEITHEIDAEVRRQLDSMTALEDNSDPNFGDADYQLAAYAAALRVLTARPIFEIDPAKEIQRPRARGEVGPVEQLIRNAVKIACDHLVPRNFDSELWKTLSPSERFYLKGVEVESHAEYRSGVYQELARGFGASDYTELLANSRANETRLKSASEFGRRMLTGLGFGGTLLRQILFAVHQAAHSEEVRSGLVYLKTELPDYWNQRAKVIHILDYFAMLAQVDSMAHWRADAEAATLLAGAVRADHV